MKKIECLEDKFLEMVQTFHGIWSKPLEGSYVSRDFLRLCNKFVVEVEDDEENITTTEFTDAKVDEGSIVKVLNHLRGLMDDKVKRESFPVIDVKMFKEEVKTIQEHHQFNLFLMKTYEEDSFIVKLLRCVPQTFVVLFLGSFGFCLFTATKLRFKDIRGNWRVIVKKFKDGSISVRHRRKEQVCGGANLMDMLFKFTWEVEMKFNKKMTHFESVEAQIVDLEWDKEEEDEEQEQIFLSIFGSPKMENLTKEMLKKKKKKVKKSANDGKGEKKKKKNFLKKFLSDMGSNMDSISSSNLLDNELSKFFNISNEN